jgi:hypothetical protein
MAGSFLMLATAAATAAAATAAAATLGLL